MFGPWPEVAVVDGAVWATWSSLAAWRGSKWSAVVLDRDSIVTRLRPYEVDGRLYRWLRVKHWKGRVPDAGRLFGGRGRVLADARTRDPVEWRALVLETRRAERVHWWIVALLPLLALWNRGILLGAMVAYAAVANIPCIAIQRYNRGRLERLLRRSTRVP